MKKKFANIGLPPGTIIHTGEEKDFIPEISVITYDKNNFSIDKYEIDKNYDIIKSFSEKDSKKNVVWVNIKGIHDVKMIEELGKVFNIHYMILEDITNIHQRPSIDTYDNIVSLQLKNICFNDKSLASELEHISIVRTDTAILSFQENKTDTFESIQNRIERQAGRIRCMNKNYLFYVLLDLIVDNYFKAIDLISDKIDMIEEEVFEDKNSVNTQEMHILKKSVLSFKRNIMPVRDIVNRIIRNDDKVFDKNLMIYFRDLYSHIINVIESVESYRDILSGLKDLYISNNSNRINEIMKTLTVVSTIFIPLGFLTGVFGMNFVEMHELNSKIAYPIGFWSVSLIIAIIMLIYFKRKKWF